MEPTQISKLLRQFKHQRESYFWLMQEVEKTKSEIEKTVQRLDLLRKLLALDGKDVPMPKPVASTAMRRRRVA
jgi:hypothetical protein